MFGGNDDARCDDRRFAVAIGSDGRRRWSAAEKAAVIRETLVPGARIFDVARRWQMGPQQVYRWRHGEGVAPRRPMRRRRADRVKILLWDGSGLVMIWKQLQQGSFRWPTIMDGVMKLSPVEFAALNDNCIVAVWR